MSEENRGRPSKTKQMQIQNLLRPYFERNMSASSTANNTDINIKTVCAYFNQWTKDILSSKNEEFKMRWREERERTALSYENLILQEYLGLEEIDAKIKKLEKSGKEVPLNLLKYKQDIMKYICTLVEKKSRILLPNSIPSVSIGF